MTVAEFIASYKGTDSFLSEVSNHYRQHGFNNMHDAKKVEMYMHYGSWEAVERAVADAVAEWEAEEEEWDKAEELCLCGHMREDHIDNLDNCMECERAQCHSFIEDTPQNRFHYA